MIKFGEENSNVEIDFEKSDGEGNVSIKGKINSFSYLDGNVKNKENSLFNKLFK